MAHHHLLKSLILSESFKVEKRFTWKYFICWGKSYKSLWLFLTRKFLSMLEISRWIKIHEWLWLKINNQIYIWLLSQKETCSEISYRKFTTCRFTVPGLLCAILTLVDSYYFGVVLLDSLHAIFRNTNSCFDVSVD